MGPNRTFNLWKGHYYVSPLNQHQQPDAINRDDQRITAQGKLNIGIYFISLKHSKQERSFNLNREYFPKGWRSRVALCKLDK